MMTRAGMSLTGRVAALIGREQGHSLEQAHEAAERMLHQLGLDLRTDLEAFVAEGSPDEGQDRRLGYWLEEHYRKAIDPDAARILEAVKATREEIEVLAMG